MKADGSVRAWRYGGRGGDASSVKKQLAEGVQYVAATCDADAAVKADGSVVFWSARKLAHPDQRGGHHHGAQQKGHTKQILIITPSLNELRRIFQKRLV